MMPNFITQESMSYVAMLPKELVDLIRSNLPDWKKVPVWKHRFLQDVLPCINESHPLVVQECVNCHFYGNLDMGLCFRCAGWDKNSIDQEHYKQVEKKSQWMESVFGALFVFWIHDTNKNPQLYYNWNQSDQMGFAIRQSQPFCRITRVENVVDTDEFILSISGLFD
jgi:hypothetical protein